jgi:prevent-host-death family protein
VDLQGGVVPISKAASALASLLKRAQTRQQPIVVTQKGYPSGVLLPIDLYVALCELAGSTGVAAALQDAVVQASPPTDTSTDEQERGDDHAQEEREEVPAPPAPPRARGGRKKRAEG